MAGDAVFRKKAAARLRPPVPANFRSGDKFCQPRLSDFGRANRASSFQLPAPSFQLPASSSQLPAPSSQLPASSLRLPASKQLERKSWRRKAGSGKLEAGSWKREAGSGKLEAGSFLLHVVLLEQVPELPEAQAQ